MKKCIKKYIKLNYYFVMGMFLFSCSSNENDIPTTIQINYDNEISNPKISIYQEENKVIYASSEKLYKNDGEDAILVNNVVSNFFNDNGVHISTLFSDSAVIENFSNNLKAFGNVKVLSDSGYTLFSNKIYWNNQYKLVTSDDSVMFTSSFQDTMYGY